MNRAIEKKRFFPFPKKAVWQALTDSKALESWLMPNDFKLEVGHRFLFQTQKRPGFDGIVHCEVIEFEAPDFLVYSWRGGGMKKPTLVKWTLKEVKGGTELYLSQSGFEGFGGLLVSFILGSGWNRLLRKKLFKYLNQ